MPGASSLLGLLHVVGVCALIDVSHVRFHMRRRKKAAHRSVEPKLTEGEFPKKLWHLHIPKTAGWSFKADLQHHLSPNMTIDGAEGCFDDGSLLGASVVAMVREPRSHALSQWNHCKTSNDFRNMGWSDEVPESFEAWIEGWAKNRDLNKTNAFCCYNPINIQSYRFTCPALSTNWDHQPRLRLDVDTDLAVANMRAAAFVGIVEAYQESICLFHSRVWGTLPAYCNCEDSASWASFFKVHDDHDVAPHSLSNYSAQVLAQVDELTALDRLLYAKAIQRFKKEVTAAEQFHGQRILCQDLGTAPSDTVMLETSTNNLRREFYYKQASKLIRKETHTCLTLFGSQS